MVEEGYYISRFKLGGRQRSGDVNTLFAKILGGNVPNAEVLVIELDCRKGELFAV